MTRHMNTSTSSKIMWVLHSEPGLSRRELQELTGVTCDTTMRMALRRLSQIGVIVKEMDYRAVRSRDYVAMRNVMTYSIAPFRRRDG